MLPGFIFGVVIIILIVILICVKMFQNIFLLNLKIGIDILLNRWYNKGTNKRCGGFNNGLRRNDFGGTGRT